MPTVYLAPMPKMQFFSNTGVPLNGGYLYTYAPGTTTNKATYSDSAGSTPNATPIVLDSAGRASIWLDGVYDMELWTGDKNVGTSTLVWTQPNVASAATATAASNPWVNLADYASLSAALTAIGSDSKTLLVGTAVTISANTVIPANVTLWVVEPGRFTIGSGKTLTINGGLVASTIYAFAGAGSVVLGNGAVRILPEWYGVTGDGTTDDTTTLQKCFDSLPQNCEVYFSSGSTYKFTEATLSIPNVTLTGPGVIDGTIKVQASAANITNFILEMYTKIKGLSFSNASGRSNAAAIKLVNARQVDIEGNDFDGFKYCIYVPPNTDPTAWGQHVGYCHITDNKYHSNQASPNYCDYFIKGDDTYGAIAKLNTGGWIIKGNTGVANIEHINLFGVDGCRIHANSMLFTAWLDESATKASCITIDFAAWVIISDNELYESGTEGIWLNRCTEYIIHDNVFGWTGERVQSSAIKISGVPLAGNYYGFGDIHDNYMMMPTGDGISLEAKAGRVTVHNNRIFNPGGADRYYGAPPLSGTEKAVRVDADTLCVVVRDNNSTYKDFDVDYGVFTSNVFENNVNDIEGTGGKLLIRDSMVVYLIDTQTTQDITRSTQLNFNHTNPTNFTQFLHYLGTNKIKDITCRFYNANTTLKHDVNKIILKGAVDVTPPTNGFMTFQVTDNGVNIFAIETSRSF